MCNSNQVENCQWSKSVAESRNIHTLCNSIWRFDTGSSLVINNRDKDSSNNVPLEPVRNEGQNNLCIDQSVQKIFRK